MLIKSSIASKYYYAAIILGITLVSPCLIAPTSLSADEVEPTKDNNKIKSSNAFDTKTDKKIIASNLAVLPTTIDLVKTFEGFRASTYIDTNGLPVIGYGQTKVNGQTVSLGQYITQAEADAALQRELYELQRLILNHVQVELNPHQLGALTSLVYNTGVGLLYDSTLISKLNAGDYAGAAEEFPRWNKAHQGETLVVLPGLTRRRLAEQKLFLTPFQ
jgi:GH24 family phage-related lysozyme (muramidase)